MKSNVCSESGYKKWGMSLQGDEKKGSGGGLIVIKKLFQTILNYGKSHVFFGA